MQKLNRERKVFLRIVVKYFSPFFPSSLNAYGKQDEALFYVHSLH